MYILVFISAIVLRYKRPNVKRAYTIPFKNYGMWIVSSLGILGTTFVIVMGYQAPLHIRGLKIVFFEVFLIGGTLFFCAVPFIIRYFRNPNWLKHYEKNNKH